MDVPQNRGMSIPRDEQVQQCGKTQMLIRIISGSTAMMAVLPLYPRSISAKASMALRACSKEAVCWSYSTASRGMPASSSIRRTGT